MQLQIMPKVSVLVAIYNIERFVGKCIRSILDQDYKNLEIILVDDCSSDSSGEICDEFAEKDDRISVFHHDINMRISSVRNTGLEKASGEYIVFVDGDDWLADDCISYFVRMITETKADMCISLNNFTTRNMRQIKQKDDIEIWINEKATAEMLFPHISIGCWNKIYRREFIENNGLRFKPELFTAEGYTFISEAAQHASYIGVGHRKVYYYRLNNVNSATTKPDVRQGTGAIYAIDCLEKKLLIKTPYVMNALYQHRFKNYFWTLRLILLTNSYGANRDLYDKCIQYIKRNAISVARAEKRVLVKIRFYLTGMAPLMAARFINCRFKISLWLDLKRSKGVL